MNHWPGDSSQHRIFEELPESIDRVVPLGDLAPNPCPKCKRSMELARADEQMVLICQFCQGLLIQSQVLARLIDDRRRNYVGVVSVAKQFNPLELKIRIDCPGCHLPMDVHPYHGPGNSIIDSCGRCGFTFLDYGELSAIERAPGRRD